MTVLADLQSEIENYARDFIELEVVDVDPAVGAAINRGEEVAFRVEVTNNGHLDVTDLSVVVTGLNGTLVRSNGAASTFGPSFTLPAGYVGDPAGGGGSVTSPGGTLTFKATSASAASRPLVRLEVGGWNGGLSHLLLGHTSADSDASGVFSAVVSPS